ncbi:MAG TPA: ATP-binding protein [Terriglobales bacterium]|nr:ATP-binding protein [Terriglobales bacterium]
MREIKELEGEVRLSEPLARLLVENAADGVYALDASGKCLWSNAAAARIFGYASASAYVGRQMHEVIHHTRADGTPYPDSECTGLQRLRAGQPVLQPEELLWRADGTSFYAEVRVNPIAPDGVVTGAVVVLRDLTERLQTEEQMRRALKMEAVGRLAAGIAHDFNNLLTVINGFAELMQQQPGLEAVAAHRLAGIGQAGERAAELTRQLLAFSRQQTLHPEVIDLNQWLHQTAATVQDVLGGELRLRVDTDPQPAAVEVDGGCLEQVLLNLAVNARDAMPAGGTLQLGTRRAELEEAAARRLGLHAGEYVLLSVSDTGHGMDDGTRQRIFEPFFTTKPVGQGSGLGLAMVLGVVEQSGGAVRVDSEPGSGAEFQIYLPAARAKSCASGR